MTSLGRIGAVILGLALALAWSFDVEARPGKSKSSKKRSTPSASVSSGSSHGSDSSVRTPSRSQPSRSSSQVSRPSSSSSSGRSHSSSGSYRPSTPYRPTEAPARDRTDSGSGRVAPQQPGSAYRSPPARPASGADRTSAAGRLSRPQPITAKVPPTFNRAGRTFTQQVIAQGDGVVVRRPTPVSNPVAAGHGHAQSATHHQHHGHHDHYYHHHYWGHSHYYCYVHYWIYEPWFWGFYFAPLPAPWYYSWVWLGAPWYVSWGWYYSPYPYYAAPSYWVTDYVIASMLEDEYARGYEQGYRDGQQTSGTPMSEPVKEQLRQQVDETAQAFQTEQPITLEAALGNPNQLFIVDTPLSVATAESGTCGLSGGDIVKPAGPVDPAVPVASMSVVTAKNESCAAGSVVSISFTDLQEMLNTFGARVDDGLNQLQKQGQTQRGETTAAAPQ